jgi:Ran GTPase-activating protein 1
MVKSSKILSLAGRQLKLNTSEDVQPYVDQAGDLREVEELALSGNSFGVGAVKAICDAMKQMPSLKVRPPFRSCTSWALSEERTSNP